jgi:MFS family permease
MSLTDPVPESIIRHRPFVLYWTARVFSALAFQKVGVSVGWQMYAITGSAFDLGLVGLVQVIPATVLVLVAGQLADRYDRRRILQICQVIEGLTAASLAWASFGGWISKEFILTAMFIFGAARAFEATSNTALLPAVVAAALFPRAVAATSSAQQAATICGPALGGLLYLLSPILVYGLSSVLFLCAATQLVFIPLARATTARPPLTLDGFFAGVSFIRHNQILFGIIALDLFAVLLGGATGLLPIFAKDVFDVGPSGLGILRAAPAVGALCMIVVLTHWTFTHSIGKIQFAAVATFGLATLAFGLSSSFPLSVVALAVMGCADSVSVVIRMTLLQIETPDDMRGRVSAVNQLFVGMSNQLGDFRAGTAAALIGAIPAVVLGGAGTLAVVAACIKAFPRLYAVESFHQEEKRVASSDG